MDIKPNIFGLYEVDTSDPNNELYIQKCKEYKDYIDVHRSNVLRAFDDMLHNDWLMSSYNHDIRSAMMALSNRIADHDMSKYSDEEFEGYRKHFYPTNQEELDNSEEEFQNAWIHHYKNNSHHPEYWLNDNNQPTDMDLVSILEMIADWGSFEYIGKGSASEYWTKESNNIVITDSTRNQVIRILKNM